jgi:RimJ/RimL family protein N-acetyltransferase
MTIRGDHERLLHDLIGAIRLYYRASGNFGYESYRHAGRKPSTRVRPRSSVIMATERGPGFERFVGRWSEQEHRAALASAGYAYLLGTPDDKSLVGFAIVRDIDDAHGNVCLKRIAVTHPGQGFGSRLLRATVDWVFQNTNKSQKMLNT